MHWFSLRYKNSFGKVATAALAQNSKNLVSQAVTYEKQINENFRFTESDKGITSLHSKQSILYGMKIKFTNCKEPNKRIKVIFFKTI